jgi:hypothetical protein
MTTAMTSFGSERGGFSVQYDTHARCVRLDTWGFWPSDVATLLPSAVLDVCATATKPWSLVWDASRLVPQREDGQRAVGLLLRSVGLMRPARLLVIVPSMMTKMQLMRLTKEANVFDVQYVKSEQEISQ